MTEQASHTTFAETVLCLSLYPYRHLHPKRGRYHPLQADSSAPRSSPMADREALDPCTSEIRDIPASLLEREGPPFGQPTGGAQWGEGHTGTETMSVKNGGLVREDYPLSIEVVIGAGTAHGQGTINHCHHTQHEQARTSLTLGAWLTGLQAVGEDPCSSTP